MGMLSRVGAVLVLLGGGLAVGAAVSPSSYAAVVPCTQTFEAFDRGGGQDQTFTADVTSDGWLSPAAQVTDVDVRMTGQTFDRAASLSVVLYHFGSRNELYRSDVGRLDPYASYDLTFDDEAPAPPAPGQTAGQVRPRTPLASHDAQPARGPWDVVVTQAAVPGFRVSRIELTITTADCDSDGDGAPETTDNCPSAVNADQADWDADGAGNACDPAPGTDPQTPPPTTTPTAPVTEVPTTPGCPAGCAYPRSVELDHKARKRRLSGTVESVALGCRSGVPVTLWRAGKSKDRKVLVVTTRPGGTYATRAPRRPGRYYAAVGSAAEPLCGTDRSRTVRIRRR